MDKWKERVIEVLAPAGSFESMKAAVNAGADAVYMGGTRFGARAYAENPEKDRLLEAIDYVHLHGRKLYLTVNTLVKERELEEELYDFLVPVYEAGVDALIVQDMGVWRAVRSWFPDLPLHASTQMTITGVNGAMEAKKAGAARIVTARELSIPEIKAIHDHVDVEIEAFVHGALCYCYSGQCLYSSLVVGRSGNRGRCAQPCRLPYEVWDGKKKRNRPEGLYVMNLKDLCGLDLLGELLDAGVCSLKIEGRMKSPRYTAGVVSVYRKYVDYYKKVGSKGWKTAKEDKEFLLELFDRGGFSNGYFHDKNGRHMVALPEKPSYRQVDAALFENLDRQYVESEIKEKIKGNLRIAQDLPATLSLSMGETSVSVSGETVLEAKKSPLSGSDLEKQMKKLGGTPFVFENLEIDLAPGCFLPVRALNELRRSAVEKLTEELMKKYRRQATRGREKKTTELSGNQAGNPVLSVLVEEEGQALAAIREQAVKRIYLSVNQVEWDRIPKLADMTKAAGKEFYLALPQICRDRAEKELYARESFFRIPQVDGFLLRVIDELPFIERFGKQYSYVADHSLYTFNRDARQTLFDRGISMDTAPLELNEKELKERGMDNSELVVYGRLPMMVSAQCIRRTTGDPACGKHTDFLILSDRKHMEFPVKNYCRFCYNVIYNSAPLWLADELPSVRSLKAPMLRLQFTVEDAGEVTKVIRTYEAFLKGEKGPDLYKPESRTRGHYRRGVE